MNAATVRPPSSSCPPGPFAVRRMGGPQFGPPLQQTLCSALQTSWMVESGGCWAKYSILESRISNTTGKFSGKSINMCSAAPREHGFPLALLSSSDSTGDLRSLFTALLGKGQRLTTNEILSNQETLGLGVHTRRASSACSFRGQPCT
uniref:Uncharacterized protein n=1 Tax=Sphaerodactylus townsendi TaxID=933632 RepID=A0ACB8E6S5_9SAUR